MAIDFDAISEENWTFYGTRIADFGQALLTRLYADRTHFLFELLQNAEDALRRRELDGPCSVTFELSEDSLRMRHYGEPFDEGDVRSICGLADSTKQEDKTAIGHFGIGFKSVYAWTDQPAIHSGDSDFVIENYVHPVAAAEIERVADETVIILPFKEGVENARAEIDGALAADARDALRFLREIDEIVWQVDDQPTSRCQRERMRLDDGVHLVTIVENDGSTTTESWLVFSAPVEHDGERVGHVEIAFAHVPESDNSPARITSVDRSPLCAYFPTELSTPLDFLIQGPYRTTPARDNVPSDDEWNQALVAQTAEMLKPTLIWLRDHGYLTVDALACMPIGPPRESTRFYPLFQAMKDALSGDAFLPAFPGGYVRPEQGLLGGTEALRKLFGTNQLKALFGLTEDAAWLDPGITRDRLHGVYYYLSATLNVREVDTERIVRQMDKAFLEQQPDKWIRSMYEFLNEQSALRKQNWFAGLPLVRLEDGTHVAPGAGDPPRAYLPASASTDFPTVRRTACDSKDSLDFLKSLGLREPDPVDDVKVNILPVYRADHVSVDDQRYERDIRRIADTYKAVDGERQRELVRALSRASFVRVIDASSGESTFARPGKTYAPTDTLEGLFRGLAGVFFVDESVAALQGDDVKRLLTACGVSDHMRVSETKEEVSPYLERWTDVRKSAGWPKSSGYDEVEDWRLDWLADLLAILPAVDAVRRNEIARRLWDELLHIASQGHHLFRGRYTWLYVTDRYADIDAHFVDQLNETAWIPTGGGALVKPCDVTIESLEWPRNSFVEERIHFRKPDDQLIIEQLADKIGVSVEAVKLAEEIEESGIPPEELRRLLKEHGGSAPQQASAGVTSSPTPTAHSGQSRSSRTEFRSYVQVRRDQLSETDSEAQAQRMDLEAKAIQHIRQSEPEWKQTEQGNAGFDLYQTGADGEIVKWCEIKSLGGAWGKHPVGLSHTQFKLAQAKGGAYWLYVVEHAGDPEWIRLLRIQDPAGLAETFTFDEGWAEIAEPDDDAG